ncbi:MAG: hypothetical protein M3Z04_19630 [Chloroflexota bacterium]|nr:hypothetical protein [Chloroflexota bacterium]
MDTAQSQRLLLKDKKGENDVHRLAEVQNWLMEAWIHAEPEKQIPDEVIWETDDQATTIHYIDDLLVQFPYLVVKGRDKEAMVKILRENLALYSADELLQEARTAQTRAEKKETVARLGVGAPLAYNEDFFQLLHDAMNDPEPEVRRVAVWVATYPAWAQLRKPLEQVRDEDSDEEVRDDARVVLASFDHHNIH